MHKTVVIIPSYKGAKSLQLLLPEVKKNINNNSEVLVVDDGSNDGTDIIAINHNVNYVAHGVNKGKGAALLTGYKWAMERGYQFAITMDADGQHSPHDLPPFFQNDADLTIGQRKINLLVMPLMRVVSNTLTSFICTLVVKKKILDSQSGYRKLRLSALDGFKNRVSGFQFETELLLHIAGRRNGTVSHVPIKTIYNGAKSYISPVKDIIQFVMAIVRFVFKR